MAEVNPGMKKANGRALGSSKEPESKVTVQTNIDPNGQKKNVKPPMNKKGVPNNEDEDNYYNPPKIQPKKNQTQQQSIEYGNEEEEFHDNDKICNFCGTFDDNFNKESIDIHYWKECPMLTTCWECEQVIEIQCMNEHLMEEC